MSILLWSKKCDTEFSCKMGNDKIVAYLVYSRKWAWEVYYKDKVVRSSKEGVFYTSVQKVKDIAENEFLKYKNGHNGESEKGYNTNGAVRCIHGNV